MTPPEQTIRARDRGAGGPADRADDQPAIVVRGLSRRYGTVLAVDDLSFDVRRGEVFALLGPNGAGKSTTVEVLEGYRQPTAGSVRVLGLDPLRDAQRLKSRIGLMLQEGGVYPAIRPLEVLRLFASFYPNPADPAALLRLVGLDDAVRTRFRQLSGGQKARLSLALALVGRPELVFLDEPTAAMDPQARRATWEIVRGLRRDGVTVLLTTHFMEEAEELADRVAIIDRGRLVALDSPTALGRNSDAPGGHHEELRFRVAPGMDLAGLAARLGAREVGEERPGEYRIVADVTPATVAALAAWLAERDVLLADLRVGRQSLEDVFLRLTAHAEDADLAASGASHAMAAASPRASVSATAARTGDRSPIDGRPGASGEQGGPGDRGGRGGS